MRLTTPPRHWQNFASAMRLAAILVAMLHGQLGPTVAVAFLEGEEAKAIKAQFDALPLGLLAAMVGYITLLLVMLRQTTQIVGERTARAVILGRYHRPRSEERFVLFIDIVGSTPVAEKLGALSVHRLPGPDFPGGRWPPFPDRGGAGEGGEGV